MKKTIFVLMLAIGQLAAAATPEATAPKSSIPEGYICANPKDVSTVTFHSFSPFNVLAPKPEKLIVHIKGQPSYAARAQSAETISLTEGFVRGVVAAAIATKRDLLINLTMLETLKNNRSAIIERQEELDSPLANTMLIDVDNLCAK